MFRFPSLRLGAATLVFSVAAVAAGPVSAAAAAPAPAVEAPYLQAIRAVAPHLPVAKAQAYARSVMADAWRTHLDPRFIMSIVTVESGWHANAVSRVGARGLGQLMPGTAATLGVNAWSPSDNLRGTSTYLKRLMDRFRGKPNRLELAIAGYNAGPKAVERYHGIPPYAETQRYVGKVLRVWGLLNARVGDAFTAAPNATISVAARDRLPDERTWVTDVNEVLPATAAAVEALPVPGSSATSDAAGIATVK